MNRFTAVSKDAQIVLLSCALAGTLNILGREHQDGGKQVFEFTLAKIGLAPDEFKFILDQMSSDVEEEVRSVTGLPDEDEDTSSDLDTMEDSPNKGEYDTSRMNKDGWEDLDR